jgi:hypothetical protein
MGAPVLPRRRRRHLPGLLGREVRRPVDHDRPGAHGLRSGERSPENWVGRQAGGVESTVCGEAPGVLTLDDVIAGAWEELSVGGGVGCPVCGERMTSRNVGGATHGDCVDCGTQLH